MLKIKDNVDLKELEKFGFKSYHTVWSSDGHNVGKTVDYQVDFEFGEENYGQTNSTGVVLLRVDIYSRQLHEYIDNRFEMYADIKEARLDLIFDLIKAGLVEKS